MSRGRRLLAAALAVVAAVAAAVWWVTAFPAERETLPGLPVELAVQDGVSAAEVAEVRAGLRAADAYLRTVQGQGVTRRVEVRVARSDGCTAFASSAGPPTGWADAGRLCLNTRAGAWRQQFAMDPALIAQLVAHEHVHNVQAQTGCSAGPDEHEWLWLFEGMATHLAFRAMVADGRLPEAAAGEQMRRWGVGDPGLRPLREYERSGAGDGDAAYALFHLATRRLDELAPRPDAMLDFCRRAAAGTPWREAFAAAFGLSVEEFYAGFERDRRRLAGVQ